MEVNPPMKVNNILEFPPKILQKIIGELNLKDRESFAISCSEANMQEKATDLTFHRVICIQEDCEPKMAVNIINSYDDNPQRPLIEGTFESITEFKAARAVIAIETVDAKINDIIGLRLLRSLCEGIRVNHLSVAVRYSGADIVNYDDLDELFGFLEEGTSSGQFRTLTIRHSSHERGENVRQHFFDMVKKLPAVPLTVNVNFDEHYDEDSSVCPQLEAEFIEQALRKHHQVKFLVFGQYITSMQYKAMFELVAESRRGCSLKLLVDWPTVTRFLNRLGAYPEKAAGGKLTLQVLEETPAADAYAYIYEYAPWDFGRFFYFPEAQVLVKSQKIRTPNPGNSHMFMLGMEKIGYNEFEQHWSVVNKSRHTRHYPIRVPQNMFSRFFRKVFG